MPLGLLALASILSITGWTPPAPLPTLNIRCSAPVLPRRPSARGRAHSGVRDGLSTPLDHSPSPCMLAAARGGAAGSSITLLGGGAVAAATLAALVTSGPPARMMLGVAGAALASCSTGFLATHATVSYGYGLSLASHAWRMLPLANAGIAEAMLISATIAYGVKAVLLQLVRDALPGFAPKALRQFRAFERTDTKCPVTRSYAKLPLVLATAALMTTYACPLYIATAAPVATASVLRARVGVAAGATALTALALESVADVQKQQVKRALGAGAPVLGVGLWRFSRHPNHFFDLVFHAAVAAAAAARATSAGALWLALAPPAACAAVVLSATRSLEARQAKAYGGDPKYLEWREATPRLVPGMPRRGAVAGP